MFTLPPRRPPFTVLPFTFALIASLTGCTDTSKGYPSLAPRPIEDLSLAEPIRKAPPPAVASVDATARYAPVVQQARDADAAFRRTFEQERSALARGRGAAQGSEEWTVAQQSLSRIESARAPVARALSDLDAARDSGPTHINTGEEIAATAAFEQVREIDAAETAILAWALPPAPR
jgi:hypothetical protein